MSAVASVSAEWTLETDIYSPEFSCNIQAVLSATGRHGWLSAWRCTARFIHRIKTRSTSVRTPGAALQTPAEDTFTGITMAPSVRYHCPLPSRVVQLFYLQGLPHHSVAAEGVTVPDTPQGYHICDHRDPKQGAENQ